MGYHTNYEIKVKGTKEATSNSEYQEYLRLREIYG